jgi:hypothetical protein
MGKKKNNDADEPAEDAARGAAGPPCSNESREPGAPLRRRGILPALSVGDILALVALIVLSAALLLEGYHKDFKDYSKEIVALFAIVVGFLLGRKT